MSIDKSGNWWVGTDAADLEEYLRAYAAQGYQVDAFRLARCSCGSARFALEADADNGAARRTCVDCSLPHLLCDSDEAWEDAEPEAWACTECGSPRANVGCGFSVRETGDVRWLYVGARCADCGVLGCYAEWKIDHAPSSDLLDRG